MTQEELDALPVDVQQLTLQLEAIVRVLIIDMGIYPTADLLETMANNLRQLRVL